MIKAIYNGIDMSDLINEFEKGKISRTQVQKRLRLLVNKKTCTQ